MKSTTNIPKFKVLVEALLEIRFDPPKDLALIVGKLNNELTDYPVFQNLDFPDFPDGVSELYNIVKYRFFSEDKTRLYNLGRGVLSFNTLAYPGFGNFIKEAEKVLDVYKKISNVSEITRIGLRYINKIPLDKVSLRDDLMAKVTLPAYLDKISTGFSLQSIGNIDTNILVYRVETAPRINKETILLDLDYYNESVQEYDLNKIVTWAKEGHAHIYQSFKASISSKLLDYIK